MSIRSLIAGQCCNLWQCVEGAFKGPETSALAVWDVYVLTASSRRERAFNIDVYNIGLSSSPAILRSFRRNFEEGTGGGLELRSAHAKCRGFPH